MRCLISFFVCLVLGSWAATGLAADEIRVSTPNRSTKIGYQLIDESKLMVAVQDETGIPIRGLTVEDFEVLRGSKHAKILSVQSLETNQDVPLNIVLVVDNSYSMKERQAVEPLLQALEEFFKTVRPIDNIHAVVFSKDAATTAGAFTTHTQTFHSSDIAALRKFFQDSFNQGLTSKTYLYEAMLAGVDIIRGMPANDNKFMVVFSDGEDLNSGFSHARVEEAADGISNFEVYTIDFMPGSKKDPFLQSFANLNGGRIWKATSATEFIPIFKEFSTTLMYRYIITYRMAAPPQGTLAIEPPELHFDILTMIDGSEVGYKLFFENGKAVIPERYVLFADRSQAAAFDANRLASAVEAHRHILNLVGRHLTDHPQARIRIVGTTSDSGPEKGNLKLAEQRSAAVKNYLREIWGIAADRLQTEARLLPANPSVPDAPGGRAENRRVEIAFDGTPPPADISIWETNHIDAIRLEPQITAEYGVGAYEITLTGDGQVLFTTRGTETLKPAVSFPLDQLDRVKLTRLTSLNARIKVTDVNQDSLEAETGAIPITVSRKVLIHELLQPPSGLLAVDPESLTIEEVTTIESSPLLNYVFFETGRSEIPSRYVLFRNQGDTETFDAGNLKGTMEKYAHLLNVLGERLAANPQARIRIVGCNSNWGAEQGRTDLSRSRAEAVRAYLRYIWGIDPARMDIEVRNQPEVASTGSVAEGRAENQRVEIHSEAAELLDTINSTYVEEISDTQAWQVFLAIQSGYDLTRWSLKISGDEVLLASREGSGEPAASYGFDLKEFGLPRLGAQHKLVASVEVEDEKGQKFNAHADASVRFIQREERMAQRQGYRVMEKYALILFDFDRAEIKSRNRAVLDHIIERIRQLPAAKVTIVGHTDIIGKEAYNLDLSKRRAKTVYDQIIAAGVPATERIRQEGAGPFNPPYDNGLPEGRAFNRTVSVTLEYEAK
jgi:outer membrane protein OmpA-like peptidoglycan-associated protein/Mg-chelatase subunit ChlD